MKLRVTYTVRMMAEVDFDPNTDDIQDTISDIDIPEGGKHNSQYVDDTFSLFEVETMDGKLVCQHTGKVLAR